MSTSTLGTAVVTGASSGIGAGYADRLARRGYDLVLVARRADRLATLAERLKADYKVAVRVEVADLAKPADLERVAAALAADASITALVNNAGVSTMKPFVAITTEESAAQIALNITAVTRLTQAVLPGFVARNKGLVVNISSVLGVQAIPGTNVYSGTKAYVALLSRGLQQELAGTNVKVHLVQPALTQTEMLDAAGLDKSIASPESVMTVDNLVDAALAGLDAGEAVTIPPLEDAGALQNFNAASLAILGGARTGKPASRYKLG